MKEGKMKEEKIREEKIKTRGRRGMLWGPVAAAACPSFVAECMEIAKADREIGDFLTAACATGDIEVVYEAADEAGTRFEVVHSRRSALVRRYFPSLDEYNLMVEEDYIALVSPDGVQLCAWHDDYLPPPF